MPRSVSEMLDDAEVVFKQAWHEADAEGAAGQRVRFGLAAIVNSGWRLPYAQNPRVQSALEIGREIAELKSLKLQVIEAHGLFVEGASSKLYDEIDDRLTELYDRLKALG